MTFKQAFSDEVAGDDSTGAAIAPGKATATSRLAPRAQHIVFRVESAEAAAVFAEKFGPRDGNGVAAGAGDVVERAASGSGAPLPAAARERFEGSLGADLSEVRVHTGAASADAAGAVGARAYTTGNDIHFGAGQYVPDDPFGLHLLAHEVAHTQQQAGRAPVTQYKLAVSSPTDAAEVEADRAADAMVTGAPAVLVGHAIGAMRAPAATGGAPAKISGKPLCDKMNATGKRLGAGHKQITAAVSGGKKDLDDAKIAFNALDVAITIDHKSFLDVLAKANEAQKANDETKEKVLGYIVGKVFGYIEPIALGFVAQGYGLIAVKAVELGLAGLEKVGISIPGLVTEALAGPPTAALTEGSIALNPDLMAVKHADSVDKASAALLTMGTRTEPLASGLTALLELTTQVAAAERAQGADTDQPATDGGKPAAPDLAVLGKAIDTAVPQFELAGAQAERDAVASKGKTASVKKLALSKKPGDPFERDIFIDWLGKQKWPAPRPLYEARPEADPDYDPNALPDLPKPLRKRLDELGIRTKADYTAKKDEIQAADDKHLQEVRKDRVRANKEIWALKMAEAQRLIGTVVEVTKRLEPTGNVVVLDGRVYPASTTGKVLSGERRRVTGVSSPAPTSQAPASAGPLPTCTPENIAATVDGAWAGFDAENAMPTLVVPAKADPGDSECLVKGEAGEEDKVFELVGKIVEVVNHLMPTGTVMDPVRKKFYPARAVGVAVPSGAKRRVSAVSDSGEVTVNGQPDKDCKDGNGYAQYGLAGVTSDPFFLKSAAVPGIPPIEHGYHGQSLVTSTGVVEYYVQDGHRLVIPDGKTPKMVADGS